MARNMVQFQKGLSEAGFDALYGTEAKCRAVVIASRWPNGFQCPACGGRAYSEVRTRGLFQCSVCRRQTSPIAGTIFAKIVPAIGEVWRRQTLHWNSPRVLTSLYARPPQAGHWKPFGHRDAITTARHFASVP